MNDILKTASMVASFGNILNNNLKDRNKFKKRMLSAAGCSFPDNWDKITETEKEKRLNKAIEINNK